MALKKHINKLFARHKDNQDENRADEQNENSDNKSLQDNPDFGSREELLQQLLNRVTPAPGQLNQANDNYNKSGFRFPAHPDEYPEVQVPADIEQKINQLQKITRNIDTFTLNTDNLEHPDFSGYKVNYAAVLNSAQLAAVITTDKPVLVIAGAGSGKTRVIVHRVSYLIEKGTDPGSILLLTFTRKAAGEMLDRVKTLLHEKGVGKVTGGTFHSFASYVLRRYCNLLQLPANFTIIDTGDSEDVIDLIRTELKFNTRDKKFPRKNRIQEIISYARNKDTTLKTIIRKQYTGLEEYIEDIELIAEGYARYKKASRLFDFDDLMEELRKGLKQNTRFKELLQKQYQYIMVDEFQDTNAVQNDIVHLLAGKHQRVMVVGDDSQSIYAFRGANYENILRFPAIYPACIAIRLEENYRSNQKILDFMNAVIDKARIGFRKNLFTGNKNPYLPVIQRFYGQDDEAVFIVDRIMELIDKGIPLSEIAVLNRADWHNRYIQAELNRRGIPYVVTGGFKFSERMHIKDIIAYLKLTYNPADAVAWHRVLKFIGGVGMVTAGNVIQRLQQSNSDLSFEGFRKKRFYNDLLVLGQMLSKAGSSEYSLTQKIEIIREYYAPLLKARETDYQQRMLDVEVLTDLSRKYYRLDQFLSDFALDPPTKRVADQSTPLIDEGEENGKITVTTIHSAKGLEWYAVFIPHALDGLFPSNRAKDIEEMEEERRLFYVACSRAKEELYITFPENMYSWDAFFHLPSRFLADIEKEKYIFRNS